MPIVSPGFSLVAEIWGLARKMTTRNAFIYGAFQSRCRDLGVGERQLPQCLHRTRLVSVSLPRFGGWRAMEDPI